MFNDYSDFSMWFYTMDMNNDNVPFNVTMFHLVFRQKNDKYTSSAQKICL